MHPLLENNFGIFIVVFFIAILTLSISLNKFIKIIIKVNKWIYTTLSYQLVQKQPLLMNLKLQGKGLINIINRILYLSTIVKNKKHTVPVTLSDDNSKNTLANPTYIRMAKKLIIHKKPNKP